MHPTESSVQASRSRIPWNSFAIFTFWLAVIGLLFWISTEVLKPKPATVTASGELVIPRARDGHYYVQGTVGGQPVLFMVDTGASMVTVSEAIARSAGLAPGTTTTFHTANGPLQGRIVTGVPVTVGPLRISGVRVGVGLVGGAPDQALLGQNFLGRFDITLTGDTMTLRPKQP